MEPKYQRTLAPIALAAALSACGGGGGTDAGNGATAAGAPGSFVGRGGDVVEVADLVCRGGSCQLPASAKTAQSGSVYQYTNAGGAASAVQVSGLSGNGWQAVVSRISAGDTSSQARLGGGARSGDAKTQERLEAESRLVLQAAERNRRSGALSSLLLRQSARLSNAQAALRAQNFALGDARVWHDMDGDSQTVLRAMRDLPNGGGKVYVWAQTGLDVGANEAQAEALAERFANSVYPLESSVVSEPWGSDVHADWRALTLPGDTRDVHLVLSRLNDPASASGSRTLGYVRWTNALLKSAGPAVCGGDVDCLRVVGDSNEALATFVDLDTFAKADAPGNWSMKDNGPSLALSTLAHEYLHVLYAYNKILRQPISASGPTVWENELAAQTMGYLVAADTFTGGRGGDANSHPDLRPRGDFETFLARPACNLKAWSVASGDYTCYPKALALGMQMLHQFGPGVMKPWVTGSHTGERALNAGLQAVGGGDYSRLLKQLTATLALAGAGPLNYGFPAKTVQLPASQYFPQGKTLRLPAVNFAANEVRWSADSSHETYRTPLVLSRGAARISVPAGSHLLLVKP